jgi:uncharacterized protein (DUF924 family)
MTDPERAQALLDFWFGEQARRWWFAADRAFDEELRRDFGRTLVTALIRLEGRTVGVMANDPKHLSGAVDSDARPRRVR